MPHEMMVMLEQVKVSCYVLVRTVSNEVEPSGLFWLKVVEKTETTVVLSMADMQPIPFTLSGECLVPGPDIEEILEVKEVM